MSAREPYERKFKVKWLRLSGSDFWHRPSQDPHHAVLCGNPPSGIVLGKATIEDEPPGPKCPDCERLRVTSLFHRRMVPPGQPDLEKAGLN